MTVVNYPPCDKPSMRKTYIWIVQVHAWGHPSHPSPPTIRVHPMRDEGRIVDAGVLLVHMRYVL